MSLKQSMPEAMEELPEETRRQIDELNVRAWEMRESDHTAAAELAETARRLSSEGRAYPRGLGWSLLTLGLCASARTEHEAAQEHIDAALEIFIRSGERAG